MTDLNETDSNTNNDIDNDTKSDIASSISSNIDNSTTNENNTNNEGIDTPVAVIPTVSDTREFTDVADGTETSTEVGSEADAKPDSVVATKADTAPVTEADTAPATEADIAPATEADTAPVTEADTAPVTEADTAPATEADTAPATEADTAPATETDTAPATEVDTAPATEADTAPATETDTASATETDTAPVTETDTAPVTETDTAPATEADIAPATEADIAPATEADTAPATETDTAPVTEADTAPETKDENSSKSKDNANGKKNHEPSYDVIYEGEIAVPMDVGVLIAGLIAKHNHYIDKYQSEFDTLDPVVGEIMPKLEAAKKSRDEINERIVVLKEKRRQLYHQAKGMRTEMYKLMGIDNDLKSVPIESKKIRDEIEELDWTLQTTQMSTSKERDLVKTIRILDAKLHTMDSDVDREAEISAKISELKETLTATMDDANNTHVEIMTIADESQKFHEDYMKYNKVARGSGGRHKWLSARITSHKEALIYWTKRLQEVL